MEHEKSTDYKAVAVDLLARVKATLADNEGWHLHTDDGTTVMYDKEIEGEPIKILKAVAFIPDITPQEIAESMWKFDFKEWHEMEPVVSSFEQLQLVEDAGEKARVCWQVNDLPWPCSSRDSVGLWVLFKEGEKYITAATSVEHPDKPETSKYVRNKLIMGVYYLEPVDGGVEVTRLMHINPGGSLPKKLVSLGNNRVFSQIKNMARIAVEKPIERSRRV
eukprot:TRINITY_DN1375_c1_g1_i3.p2 TRINITY_DN1375_c1_g1~~TRINITY_DN1375_c1_g1_i3.p2  ORF type:complete len:220 (+),score=46.03 TRINITY_DN1375_c1_g1_i3:183-842(+)